MITLHQMLHGYKLGHNYIQGSIVLPSTHDMDKIATLSDWSEYVGVDNRRDYITAYPLDESPYYVVAMTWYADTMRRPGCVWTHSLLIHKDDLGKISDFCNLLYLFVVPVSENDSFDIYSTPLAFVEDAKEAELQLSPLGENKVAEVYECMLSEKPVFILNEFTSQQSQELMLSLLNYVPLEILKNKSICSGTAAPRAYEGQYLSLQFVTHDGNSVSYLTGKSMAPWLQLVGVSVTNNRPQVARLIKHYQDEIGDSIEKLSGFLSVVVLINRACKDDNEKQQVLLEIIETLTKAFPGKEEGNVFKSAVFQPSLARDFGGEENFLYTISTISVSSFTEEQIDYKKRLHDLSTEHFLGFLKRLYSSENVNDWGMQTIKNVDQYVSYTEISGLRKNDFVFFQTIICSSSVLLNQIVWSDFSKEELQSTLAVFSDREMVSAFKHWRELFKAMLDLKVPIATELVRMVFSHDKSCVSEYLTYLNVEVHQPQLPVSRELEHYPDTVLDWLSRESVITNQVAYVLVNSIDEEGTLIKKKGSKIWRPFANELKEKDPIQYFVFLYILSFNWQDTDALAYLKKAFYPIHKLLLEDKLDYNLWYRVEPYTEHRFIISFWDKCKKMRKMVIRRLKEAGYTRSVVANYTPDAKTNEWLLNEW